MDQFLRTCAPNDPRQVAFMTRANAASGSRRREGASLRQHDAAVDAAGAEPRTAADEAVFELMIQSGSAIIARACSIF